MRLRFLSVLAVLALCLPAYGKGFFFQNIPPVQGVAGAFTCTYVEPRGFAWCGTESGLVRYGYGDDSKVYTADGLPGSLPGDFIYGVLSDESGTVWVFTDGGVASYNRADDNFTALTIVKDGTTRTLTGYCMLDALDGRRYIGGDGTLYVFEDGELVDAVPAGTEGTFRIDAIQELGGSGTLLLYSNESGQMVYSCRSGQMDTRSVQIQSGNAYCLDSRGRFWRALPGKGVECYDSDGILTASYNTSNSALASNTVNCFLENGMDIWIGTEGGGISILRPETGEITTFTRKPEIYNSFPCYSVRTMGVGGDGSVWAGRPDMSIVVIREVYMRTVAVAPIYDQTGRCSDEVLSFAESGITENRVWIGTASSGLYHYDIDSKDSDFNIFRTPSVGNRPVESILALPDGKLLMSIRREGLFLFNERDFSVKRWTHRGFDDEAAVYRASGNSVSLSYDDKGNVIISCRDLYVWDLASDRIIRLPSPTDTGQEPMHPVSGSEGRYFHTERHIYFWDSSNLKYESVYDAGEDKSLNSVSMDPQGNLWMATSDGVYSLYLGDSEAGRLDVNLFKSAESIIADKAGRIWIAGNGTLFTYLPESDNILRFTDNDGVNWNIYNGDTYLIAEKHILLGGTNGFLTIDPNLSFYLTDKPDLIIQDIWLNGRRTSSAETDLRLTSKIKTLKLRVYANEDNMLRSKLFRFEVHSSENVSSVESESPELELSFLPAGHYTIYASCTMQNGEWMNKIPLISLTVIPIWYKAWYFWLGISLLLILILILIFHSIKSDSEFKLSLAESEARTAAGQENLKFLLNVSHEIKTPLTLIISPLSRILSTKGKDDPEYRTLSNIYRQANRIRSLVLTILDAHKIQEGSATFFGEQTGYNAWMETIVNDFEEECESRGITLVRNYDSLITDVMIDSQKLENVITNLMNNALKHSPDNTVITTGTKYIPETKCVRSFVSDRGEGLGGIDMTKLFSRYYQGMAQKTGSGLGLAYANSIVEMHSGTMGAYENEGGGSTFYFDMPYTIRALNGLPVEAPAEVEAKPAKTLSEASLLVVDDDPDLREYLMDELSGDAGSVHVESNGKKALDYLQDHQVDVVISDVMMPVMDGFELCEAIKKSPVLSSIPVILLTARVESNSREHGLSLGADAYVPKPFERKNLLEIISKLCK